MTINPKDAKPDQPYEVDLDGERYVAMRNNPRQEHSQWRLLPEPGVQALWAGDGAVKNLVPLVPARNITRDDLPSVNDVLTQPGVAASIYGGLAIKTLNAVVAHLNERGGIPAEARQSGTHINVTGDPDSTPADFSEKLRKLSEEFRNNAQMRALRDAEGNIVEHLITPRKFAAGGYVPSPEGGDKSCCERARLLDNELARRNEELSEAQGEIALQKERAGWTPPENEGGNE